uniref:Canalicular multispecific organic anion transporter 1-like n=1 Tax=Scleropages formosus TaxID=113540 RepID=A0A8C9T6S9_SCLFO
VLLTVGLQLCLVLPQNNSYLERPDPDLPECLELTVLVWVPLSFLWAGAPWQLSRLFRRKAYSHFSKLYICKQVLVALLFLTAIAGLAVTLGEDYGPSSDSGTSGTNPVVFYTNPVLFAVSWVLVMLCQESVRKAQAVDSGALFIFWALLVVCGIFPFQTLLRKVLDQGEIEHLPRFCLFYISYGLQVLSLILSGFADPGILYTFTPRAKLDLITQRMVLKGFKHPLMQEDLWDLNEEDTAHSIHERFEKHLKLDLGKAKTAFLKRQLKAGHRNEHHINGLSQGVSQDVLVMDEMGDKTNKKNKKKSKDEEEMDFPRSWLVKSLAKTYKWQLLESAFFKLLQDLLGFVSPQLLKLMISFTQDMSIHTWMGYMYAILLMVVAFFQSVFLQQYFQRCFVIGMQVRTALTTAVYKKALVVSNDTRKQSTVGETVNLISADAQRFSDVTNFIHLLWSCPLQIILAIFFLWLELGPAVLAGLGVMLLMIPINALLATKSRGFQVENMKFKDKRLKLMNEILNGIKVIKLYAWESSFAAQIQGIREKELKVMHKFAYLSSVSLFIFSCAPALVSLATFAVFVSASNENNLDAEKAFTSISLFNILRFPLAMLPQLISALVQTTVSNKRLEKFLGGDELDSTTVRHDSNIDTAVSVCAATLAWEKDAEPVLKNVSLDIKPGSLVAVVGAVGSGKSSLISALLGEMHNLKGYINIQGSLAYVPQQAWIQNATLKDNILFGSQLEEKRYQMVLNACALRADLELLPAGIDGGQKQRVSLARATYSSADIYLLDDPLSAVDPHVGKHLFDKVVGPHGLLKNKTRVLVTHGVNFLPYVDEIVVLTDGKVSEVGSYQSLQNSGGAFSEFLNTYAKEESSKAELDTVLSEEVLDTLSDSGDLEADSPPEDVVSLTVRRESILWRSQHGSIMSKKNSLAIKPQSLLNVKAGQRLIEKEAMETGQVKFSVYMQYLRSVGWGYFISIFLAYFIQNVAFIGQNLWLSDWTNDSIKYFNTTYPPSVQDMRVGVFGGLGLAQGLLMFVGTLLMANGSISASRILHSRLLDNVLRVPMVFFDTTPSGRILNRFAKDIFTVDEAIPMSIRSWLLCFLGVIGTLFIICLATPLFVAVVIPLAVVYYFVQRFYLATSRQLRRLDSVSRSPIYSHFGETVTGLSVIRAYGHQERFLRHNEATINENLKSFYPWIVSNRWLAMRLEFLGNLVVFFAALFAVLSRESLESGMVGLSISYALNVTQTLNWLVRMNAELETNIVAVERVNEYTKIENEAPWITDTHPADSWPDSGKICFENFKLRYRPELDLVLRGITCDIGSMEKIGIVGRTGAGKSSLTNCLFRIIEAAEGCIFIDGVDIATLGLHDLRNRLTIIPQDPVLFSGTLRMNLDPFEKVSDEELWQVLELSHLKDFVTELHEGLYHEITEGGENLSVGQRQLLCLARALLRKSRILILDEATAAVDLETDDLIQSTIRKQFSHCTVLTIAHRLHTILDSSRVMVLDAGRIVEFDSPSALLQKQGHFCAMAKDAGISSVDSTAL